jgi:hypothetical protein
MPNTFRKVYADIEREQSIEQLGLAIKMVLPEPAVRHLFAPALQQPKPQQRSQDTRLRRVGRPVQCPGKHRRFRNSAKPGQFLGGLPVIGANQQRPKHDPGVRLWPRPEQPAAEVAQVYMPE